MLGIYDLLAIIGILTVGGWIAKLVRYVMRRRRMHMVLNLDHKHIHEILRKM